MIIELKEPTPHGFNGPVSSILLSSYLLSKPWMERLDKPSDDLFDGRHIMLTRPLVYISKPHGGKQYLTCAEAGYVSDGASVPTILGLTYVIASPPIRESLPGSVIHDKICDMVVDLIRIGQKKEAANLRAFADVLYGEMNSKDVNPDVKTLNRMFLSAGVGLWGRLRYKSYAYSPSNPLPVS